MSENVKNTEFDVLILDVDLDLSKVKSKLRRKIVKQFKKEKIKVEINIDIYGAEESTINILTDDVSTLKPKKRKKTKKS